MGDKNEVCKDVLLSAAFGFLAIRALPMAAVLAGWSLSASLGADAGELLAAVIFTLGCAIVIISRQMDDERIYRWVRIAAAVVSILSSNVFEQSAENRGIFIAVLDCLLVTTALLAGCAPGWDMLIAGGVLVLLAVLPPIWGGGAKGEMLLPISAALSSGVVLTYAASERKIKTGTAAAAMAAAMLIDILK